MAKLYDVAKDLKDVAEEGIGWLLVWREGHGWKGVAVWPDYHEATDDMDFQPDEKETVIKATDEDPDAIIVNSWIHNLGVEDYEVSVSTLENCLRYHYRHKTSLAMDYIY